LRHTVKAPIFSRVLGEQHLLSGRDFIVAPPNGSATFLLQLLDAIKAPESGVGSTRNGNSPLRVE